MLVGYTAAGLNDAKPTPAGLMPGVEVHAEATEALLAGSAIWLPPAWLKYALAAVLVLLTTFAFFRGEPASEIDDIFVATNLFLLLAAFVGLTAFGVFFDIFAAIGFVSLYFGLCRLYAGVQRGRAIGNSDFRAAVRSFTRSRPGVGPGAIRARCHAVHPRGLERRLREYRRRLRRYVHGGIDAVMLEGVVERKSWLWEAMEDVTVLVWTAPDRATATAAAERELDGLHAHLIAHDDILPDDGSVHVAIAFSEEGNPDPDFFDVRAKVRDALGRLLAERTEWPLSARNALFSQVADSRRNAMRLCHAAVAVCRRRACRERRHGNVGGRAQAQGDRACQAGLRFAGGDSACSRYAGPDRRTAGALVPGRRWQTAAAATSASTKCAWQVPPAPKATAPARW